VVPNAQKDDCGDLRSGVTVSADFCPTYGRLEFIDMPKGLHKRKILGPHPQSSGSSNPSFPAPCIVVAELLR
jgi:hypothetical protein